MVTQVAVFRDIGKSYLSKIRQTSSLDLYLWFDSGSKALSQLPTILDIVRLTKRLKFCRLVTSTTATRSWDESSTEGSIFSLPFALIWGLVVVPCSDWPPSTKLFKNFHNSALCRTMKRFNIECKQRPQNWQKIRAGQSLKTPISCSYWLPSVTKVPLQTVLSFVLDSQCSVSCLLDE